MRGNEEEDDEVCKERNQGTWLAKPYGKVWWLITNFVEWMGGRTDYTSILAHLHNNINKIITHNSIVFKV